MNERRATCATMGAFPSACSFRRWSAIAGKSSFQWAIYLLRNLPCLFVFDSVLPPSSLLGTDGDEGKRNSESGWQKAWSHQQPNHSEARLVAQRSSTTGLSIFR